MFVWFAPVAGATHPYSIVVDVVALVHPDDSTPWAIASFASVSRIWVNNP